MPLENYNWKKPESDQSEKKNSDRYDFLNLRHIPAIMPPEEAARYLGFAPHEMPILVAHGLLKPLGNPVQSSVKYFAKVVLDELGKDVEWLHRAKATCQNHWTMKNARKSANAEYSSLPQKNRAPSRRPAKASK
jgi:hypothetical protein